MLVSRHLISILLAASAVGVAGAAEPDCGNPSSILLSMLYACCTVSVVFEAIIPTHPTGLPTTAERAK